MALVKCPFCGESVSDLATQCPHCQNKLTNKVQCNRSGMYSLIAMLLYVAGTILFIISAAVFCSNYKVFDFGVPQSWQIAGVWYIELSKMPVLVYVRVSLLIFTLAWLFWFLKDKDYGGSIIRVDVAICVSLLLFQTLKLVNVCNEFNIVISNVLLLALGVVLFFQKAKGMVKKYIIIVGMFYLIFYLFWFFVQITISHFYFEWSINLPLVKFISSCVLHLAIIVMFYASYKQSKSSLTE